MTLADTSVWIAVFRARRPLDLEAHMPFDEVVTRLPVIQEVLQGFADERAYGIAADSMAALPVVESLLQAALFREAVALYRSARRSGHAVRSPVDRLIAACALRHDVEVLHADRDFGALAEIAPLRERSV
ncbi:MAG: type II toxin-antitoxin system VapC family toxin [Planctomycetota bacterium]